MTLPADARPAGDTPDDALAHALLATGLVSDPWVDGRLRFARQPLALAARELEAAFAAAEGLAAACHQALQLVLARPALLDEFFALTPVQKAMWASSAPLWHGLARADVFLVDGGPGQPGPRPVVCELNCDTPSGQPEAVLLGPATGVPAARDPNTGLEARFGQLLQHFLRTVTRADPQAPHTVGIVYPTEIAGDFALIRLYQRWCQRLGLDVVLGSPFNLRRTRGGGVALFGTPCDLIIRHYKTDWWGERLPVWADEEPYPDAEPLTGPLSLLLEACAAGRCAVLNPFGSVLAQNKRLLAFLWEHQHELPPEAGQTVRDHLPPTWRLEAADRERLPDEKDDWVLKSDYGCEGEEVVIGREVSSQVWRDSLAQALPRRWIVQRYFQARRNAAGEAVNHGVFLVAGQAAGLYARLSRGATDAGALSAAVEIIDE